MTQEPSSLDTKTNILIVDDIPANLVVLGAVLDRPDYNLVQAQSGHEALETLQQYKFAVIVLDVRMPGMDGFETATVIKSRNKDQFIPIIFISASLMDEVSIQRGYEVGAVEYLVKPFDPKALRAKVAFFVDLYKKNLKTEEQTKLERTLIEQSRENAIENLRIEKELREKFVATLAHDLRNPIAAAKMSVQLIERNPETPETNRKQARRLIENIQRADTMIENLLDANRLRAGESLPIDVSHMDFAELLRDVTDDLTTIYGDRFVINSPPKLEGYWCPIGMRRVLENLMGNGAKYGDSQKPVTISLEDQNERIKIDVHNEGKPLSAEQQKNIFELYKRSFDVNSKGWGLGLTLVRGLVESHGGKVEIQSSQAKGTSFVVTVLKDCRTSSQGNVDDRSPTVEG